MMKLNQNKLACEKKRLIQPGKKKMLYCSVAETVLVGNLIAKEMWDTMRYTGQMEATRLIYSSGDLKIMFEPDSDDEVWKNHQHQELIEWKLYDSCVSLCDLLGGTAEGFTTISIPVTTTSASISTVSPPRDSTAEDISGAEILVYIRRSAKKRKDKGKAIIKEDESVQKKDVEIAKQLQEEFDRARQEQEVVAEADQALDIDWSNPVVLRYHTVQNRSFSKAEVRKNMCIYLKNQGGYKQSHFKGMSYEDIRPIFERKNEKIESKQVEEEIIQPEDVVAEQVVIESSKKAGGILKRKYVKVISNSEEVISVIPLDVKSLIVSWKSYCKGDVGYYEIHRTDGSYKTYIFFSKMLNDFDREDLIVLYRLLNEKYASTRPGIDDLMLWGDLKIMFEPDSDDEVWKNHQHQELIEWKLYDSCVVHSLMLGEVSIHMLVEKKYPLVTPPKNHNAAEYHLGCYFIS
ncbi:hypothetical protein Tco_0405032 [Tanacetum coccineum]